MANASDYLEDKWARHVLLNQPYTSPATVYLALYTSNPTDADVGTEVAGGLGYARQLVAPSVWSFAGTPSFWWQNSTTPITFGPATGSWGTVTHLGFRDAASGGNLLIHAPVSPTVAVTANQLVTFLNGTALIVQVL